MENFPLDILEVKITKIISMLDHIKQENKELQIRNRELNAQLEEKEKTSQTLMTALKKVEDEKKNVETYKEKQDKIRSKLETLLDKLKEFEDIE